MGLLWRLEGACASRQDILHHIGTRGRNSQRKRLFLLALAFSQPDQQEARIKVKVKGLGRDTKPVCQP